MRTSPEAPEIHADRVTPKIPLHHVADAPIVRGPSAAQAGDPLVQCRRDQHTHHAPRTDESPEYGHLRAGQADAQAFTPVGWWHATMPMERRSPNLPSIQRIPRSRPPSMDGVRSPSPYAWLVTLTPCPRPTPRW